MRTIIVLLIALCAVHGVVAAPPPDLAARRTLLELAQQAELFTAEEYARAQAVLDDEKRDAALRATLDLLDRAHQAGLLDDEAYARKRNELLEREAATIPALGVTVTRDPTLQALVRELLDHPAGLLVTAVMSDTPAARAGFVPGDLLIACGPHLLTDAGALRRAVEAGGDIALVVVRRDGEQLAARTLTVTLPILLPAPHGRVTGPAGVYGFDLPPGWRAVADADDAVCVQPVDDVTGARITIGFAPAFAAPDITPTAFLERWLTMHGDDRPLRVATVRDLTLQGAPGREADGTREDDGATWRWRFTVLAHGDFLYWLHLEAPEGLDIDAAARVVWQTFVCTPSPRDRAMEEALAGHWRADDHACHFADGAFTRHTGEQQETGRYAVYGRDLYLLGPTTAERLPIRLGEEDRLRFGIVRYERIGFGD